MSVTPRTSTTSRISQTFHSRVESAILKSTEPIHINETQEITVNNNRGIWANRCEVCTWRGDLPITDYPINEDACPQIINKKSCKKLDYTQEIAIRYLKPPAPPTPGDIVIRQEPNKPTEPAPPVIIRQQPPRPCTPEPLVIRETPPQPPPCIGQTIVTIPGKRLPAPPRKVVVERMPTLPNKPQSVLIERWLPYVEQRRRVIFQKAPPDPIPCKPKNIIIQWETPEVCIKKDIKHLGVVCANPCDYVQKYGNSLRKSCELPQFVKDIKPQCGIELAADKQNSKIPELEGDICALNLINLECEGLGQYREQLERFNCNNPNASCLESSPCGAAASDPCAQPCPDPCNPCNQCPEPCPAYSPCSPCSPYDNNDYESSFQLAPCSNDYTSALFDSNCEEL